jgi:pyruvate-formate lyase
MFIRQDEIRPDDRYYWVTANENGSYTATPKALEDREESDKDGNPMFVQVYDEATKSMVDSTERLITKGLKSNHIAQVKHNTNMTLAQTDWYVIRKAERNIAIPADVAADRAAIVAWATATEASITAVTTVEELKAINLGVSI